MNQYQLARFLSGCGADSHGRLHSDIIRMSDEELESAHDIIQWLFPLHETSAFNPTAPIVTPKFLSDYFEHDMLNVKSVLVLSVSRFRRFYGLGTFYHSPTNCITTHAKWCYNGNHNLLRITRIIRSLRLFQMENEAKWFHHDAVIAAYTREPYTENPVTHETITFWDKALNDYVWSPLR